MHRLVEKKRPEFFAVSQMGSGGDPHPLPGERGRVGGTLFGPFKGDPIFRNGTLTGRWDQFLEDGTHILQGGPLVWVVQGACRRALRLGG
jgi:hypothetical protein